MDEKESMSKIIDAVLPSAPVNTEETLGSVCLLTPKRNVQQFGGWWEMATREPLNFILPCNLTARFEVILQQFPRQGQTTEWERLEISPKKLEIPREHFMQRWAQ